MTKRVDIGIVLVLAAAAAIGGSSGCTREERSSERAAVSEPSSERAGAGELSSDAVARSGAPGGSHGFECPEVPPGRTTVLAAMLSFHAHSHWPNGDFPSDVQEVMPLNQAVACLRADHDTLAPSRRRRAIALLGARGIARDDFQAAITNLGGNVPQIRNALQAAHLLSLSEPAIGIAVAHAEDDEDPQRIELIEDLYADSLAIPGCPWQNRTKFSPAKGIAGAATLVTVEVQRDIDAVKRAIDAQNWDFNNAICGKYFAQTDLVDDKTFPTIHLSTPLPSGSIYPPTGTRLLYEHFNCPKCPSEFKNFLNIHTWDGQTPLQSGASGYNVGYALEPDGCLYGSMGPGNKNAKLNIDNGTVAVEPMTNGWQKGYLDKRLNFEDPAQNASAVVSLQLDEIAGEFTEVVCCPVPP